MSGESDVSISSASQPQVTVLTPFYNTAAYLAECIESVLAQSYANWTYILVDNCSTDGSSEIAESYAARDPRIQVIRTERFLGQVENYNHAIRQVPANSKYFKVVQADDAIYPECLRKMVELFESDDSIGLVSAYYRAGDQGINLGPPGDATRIQGIEMARLHLLQRSYGAFGSPSSVMYRSTLVRSRAPFYSERSVHEDTEVCYEILLSWNFGYVRDVLTFTRTDNDSITNRNAPLNALILDRLILMRKYGLLFLQPDEFRIASVATENRYRVFIAKALLTRRDATFWAYHRRGLATIGTQLDMPYKVGCLWSLIMAGALKLLGALRIRKASPLNAS